MARQVLPIVGAVVGAFFGAPQIGFAIGSIVGNLVDPVVNQGPKMGELPVQTSQEGSPRALIYGTSTCTGYILAFGAPLKTISIQTGEKGAPTSEVEVIYRNYAIAICEGPIGGVLRIWRNDKLVYDVRPGSPMIAESLLWMQSSTQGKVLYLGGEDQLPDTYLQLNVSGIGETPAYRGTAYMVFGLDDLTDTQGAIPQYRWEVAMTVEASDLNEPTASTLIPVFGGVSPAFECAHIHYLFDDDINVGVGRAENQLNQGTNHPYTIATADRHCDFLDEAGVPLNWATLSAMSPSITGVLGPFAYGGPNQAYAFVQNSSYPGETPIVLFNGSPLAVIRPSSGSPASWWDDNTTETGYINRTIWFSEEALYIGVTSKSGVPVNSLYRWSLIAGFPLDASASVTGICATPGAPFFVHLGRDGKIRVVNDAGALSTYSDLLDLQSSVTLPFNTVGLHGFGVDGALACFVYGNVSVGTANRMDLRSTGDWALISSVVDSRFSQLNNKGTRLIFTDESLFVQCQQDLMRFEYGVQMAGLATNLGAIVSDQCDRAGLPQADYDVSELTPISVTGMTVTGDYTAADCINTLRGCYFFDKAEPGDKLYFPLRGKPVVGTLTFDDLVDVPDTARREQLSEIPRSLHLFAQNPTAGYSPVKQSYSRSSVDVKTVAPASVSVPVVLDVDEQMKMAHKIYKVMAEDAQGEIKLSIPDQFIHLVPSDAIGLSLRGQVRRLRIDDMEWADGVLSLVLRADRQSAYTSVLTGIPIPAPATPPSTIVGNTTTFILDVPARQDIEDDLHLLVAGTGTSDGWYGWALQRSTDGGATWTTVKTLGRPSVMGALLDSVPAAAEGVTDTTNTVRVDLFRDDQAIESITDTQFLAEGGSFALGKADGSWEIMQYLDADQESMGAYALTTLHRGLLNSGAAAHLAGAKFVMLETAEHIPMPSSLIGQSVSWRGVSLGQSPELATAQAAAFVGRSQIEWPVTSLTLSRSGADVITATWAPRHRFGTDDVPVASVNFTGYRVTIVGSSTVTFDTTAPTFTYDASALGASVTVSVSAINRITGAGPATSEVI